MFFSISTKLLTTMKSGMLSFSTFTVELTHDPESILPAAFLHWLDTEKQHPRKKNWETRDTQKVYRTMTASRKPNWTSYRMTHSFVTSFDLFFFISASHIKLGVVNWNTIPKQPLLLLKDSVGDTRLRLILRNVRRVRYWFFSFFGKKKNRRYRLPIGKVLAWKLDLMDPFVNENFVEASNTLESIKLIREMGFHWNCRTKGR